MARTAPAHIPRTGALLGLFIALLVLAIVELGLTAYYQTAYSAVYGDGGPANILSGAIGFGLFTAIWTFLISLYFLITTRSVYKGYHKIAGFTLMILTSIFWLVTFSLWARIIALLNRPYTYYSYDAYGDVYYETYYPDSSDFGIPAAVLAIAIVTWLLTIAITALLLLAGRGTRATTTTTTTYDDAHAKAQPTTTPMETLPANTHAATPAEQQV